MEAVCHVVQRRLHLCLDKCLWQLDVEIFCHLLHQLLAKDPGCGVLLHGEQVQLETLSQGCDVVELGDVRNPVVGDVGQLLGTDTFHKRSERDL